jgi:hypothetical protein
MSNFALYIIGFIIIIAGLAWGAHMMGLATQWIVIGALVLIGIAFITGISKTRVREMPGGESSSTKRVIVDDN